MARTIASSGSSAATTIMATVISTSRRAMRIHHTSSKAHAFDITYQVR